MDLHIDQQCHGYKSGHQVLASSIEVPRVDQDVLDRLSDISGPLSPGETFTPYLTAYPLPSGSFYVFAKTWQDLKAPRAGCVLTRSLLVPIRQWELLDSIASLVHLLIPVDKEENRIRSIDFNPPQVPLKPVGPQKTIGLVESIFLESRKPVVVFEEQDAETITFRLLAAFWPSIRRSFSVCTLALSSRAIGGRPFDLLFAPNSARSRFAHWPGRVLEPGSPRDNKERHRWTLIAAKHIFENDPPSLMPLDALGVLRLDEQGDESGLRLVLLWNELLERSEGSPTAVLGLLDILNSRQVDSSAELNVIVDPILRALDSAQHSMPPLEGLKFIHTLLGKLTSQTAPRQVLKKAKECLSKIAADSSTAAVSLLEDALGKWVFPDIVFAGIGDGLSEGKDRELLNHLSQLRTEVVSGLLAYSPLLAGTVMRSTAEVTPDVWANMLTSALQFPDEDRRSRAKHNIAPFVRLQSHVSVLRTLLENINARELEEIVRQIGEKTGFEIVAFDEEFRRAARTSETTLALRSAILDVRESPSADRFLLSTLQPEKEDIGWILEQPNLTNDRKARLLTPILTSASDREVRALSNLRDLCMRMEAQLLPNLPDTALPLARMLVVGNPSVAHLLGQGPNVLPYTKGAIRNELLGSMLSHGLSSAPKTDNYILAQLVRNGFEIFRVPELITFATPTAGNPDRIAGNLLIMNEMETECRRKILSEIEYLTDRLVALHGSLLPAEAICSWATLLKDSGDVNTRSQLRAASVALSYALEQRSKPVSELIVATFPVVYAQLKAGKESPNLLSFLFTDWDRCKVARRDLVRAFLRSNWPPSDLLRSALPTGDLQIVLEALKQERPGDAFIRRMRSDLDRIPTGERKQLTKILSLMFDHFGTR